MIHAVEMCCRSLGRPRVSRAEYDLWRKTADDALGAPSCSRIIYAWGTWNAALARVPGATAIDPTSVRLHRPRAQVTAENCLEAIRTWHAQTGQRRIVDFRSWVRTRVAEDPSLPWPLHEDAIYDRLPGVGWEGALNACGILSSRQLSVGKRRDRDGARFTTKEVSETLRQVHAEIGEPFTQRRYERWRAGVVARAAREGRPSRIPSERAVRSLFGTWQRGLAAALPGRDPTAPGHGRSRRFEDAALVAAYRQCERDLGHPPDSTQYRAWRRADPERPSSSTIALRIAGGSWPAVANQVRGIAAAS